MTIEELATRVEEGRVVVLDVRSRPEYDAGHVAGALSAPIEGAGRARRRSARGRRAGRVLPRAVLRLRRRRRAPAAGRGRTARRLDVGFPEWRRAGQPVAASASAKGRPREPPPIPQRLELVRQLPLRLHDALATCGGRPARRPRGCLRRARSRHRRPDRCRLRDPRAGRPRVGLPALVERTGATAYLPADAGVEFDHRPLADGEEVELGNTIVRAIATMATCSGGRGGVSCSRASANASASLSESRALWVRSNPIDENGLPDSPRPQTEPP